MTYEKFQVIQSNIYNENNQNLFNTPYKNNKDYLYFNLDAIKRFKRKATFNVGYTNVYKCYDSKSGILLSESDEYRNIFYTSLSYSLTRLLSVRFGGIYRHIKRSFYDSGDETQDLFSCNLRFFYNLSPNRNFEFTYSNKMNYPNQKQTNTNGKWINSEVYSVGNQYLKAAIIHCFNVHTYFKPFSFDVKYDYSGNNIYQLYEKNKNATTISYENIKTGHLSGRLTAYQTMSLWGGSLTLNGMLGYELYSYKYTDTEVNNSFWVGTISVNYRKGRMPTIGISYNDFAHDMRTLQGYSITGPDTWTLSLQHIMCNCRLITTINYTLPIAFTNKWNFFTTRTSFYESTSMYNAYNYVKNTFNLSIIYRFAKGKRSYRKKTIHNIEVE